MRVCLGLFQYTMKTMTSCYPTAAVIVMSKTNEKMYLFIALTYLDVFFFLCKF